LADDHVEQPVVERKLQSVGLTPDDPLDTRLHRRKIEHRLVKIGRNDFHAGRKRLRHRTRDDAGPRCDFEYPRRRESPDTGD
jgi:hypothetical protein